MSDPLKPLFGGPMPALEALSRKASAARSLTERVRAAESMVEAARGGRRP